MKNLKFVLLVVIVLTSFITFSQDFKEKKYKAILPNYIGVDSSIIYSEFDSTIFQGFIVFGYNKFNCPKDNQDTDLIKMDLFFLKNLEDFGNTKSRYYYSSDYYWYLAQYLSSTEPVKIFIETKNGDSLVTTNYGDEKLKILKSDDFQHFKNLYSKFYNNSEKKGMFFEKDLTCEIFDNSDVLMVSYNYCDSIGYYIFQCSFPTSVLNFHAYCIKNGCNNESKENIEKMGFIKVLMPIDSFITFKTVDVKILKLLGFDKSKWLPPIK